MSVVIEDFTEAFRVLCGRHHGVCVIDGFHSTKEAVVEAVDAAVDLNPEQKLAVEHGGGEAGGPSPLVVIAAAGSGKTAMLAHWVAARILGGADPKRIMLATYSRQAAAEINRRVERIVARRPPPEAAAAAIPAWSGTFSAMGSRLLREYAGRIGLDPQFTIHDREGSAAGMLLRTPRRPRRLSLREAERQAGRPVASVTDRPDGSRTYAFGDTANAGCEVNDWDIEYGASSPSSVRQ
jgi:hypothetical protein